MPFVILSILMALIVAAVPVAAVLGILSLSLDELFMRGRRSLMLGDFVWEQSIEYILVAIPMFILLGEIMLRAGIALRMYNAVIQWLSWLPGGLMVDLTEWRGGRPGRGVRALCVQQHTAPIRA